MLNLDWINILDKHFKYLKTKINKENIFIVWWSIRDILLDIEKDPKDIDITTDQDPQTIFSQIKQEEISIFKTDKFGTITIVPKWQDSNIEKVKYELTPLRSEWQYDDFRHPWKINRTNNIVLDSKRRDFTINCLYYFSIDLDYIKPNYNKIKDELDLIKKLKKNWKVFLLDKNILIIKDKELINKLFPNANLDIEILKDIIKNNSYNISNDFVDKKNISIIIDPWWGIEDILNKKIKAVWEADSRFQEDALRIIRWVRIPNILNQKIKKDKNKIKETIFFDYDWETWASMKKNYFLVQFIAKERIKDEIMKVFIADNPFGFVVLLDELNILKYIFPYLYMTKNNNQPVRYHAFDTYAHTILCFYNIQFINKDPLVRFAMLYHDVGKPDQYYCSSLLDREERKKIHSMRINHSTCWADMTLQDFKKLWFSKKECETISFYVKEHLLAWEILSWKEKNIIKKIKKLLSSIWYKKLQNLIDICIADRRWQYNPLQLENVDVLQNLKKLIDEIYEKQWEFTQKDLKIDGNIVIEEMQINPWPQVWILLQKALNWVIQDIDNRNNKEIIIEYLNKNM